MVSIPKLFLTVVIGFGLCHFSAAEGDAKISAPETEMVDLAAEIGSYVRERKPDFLLIGNGGVGLLEVTEDNAEENVARLIRVLDGFFMESRFYDGRTENGAEARRNNRATDEFLTAMLEKPLRAERQVFTLDYVKGKKIHTAQEMGAAAGYVSDGGDTALDVIPDRRPMYENTGNVTQLKEAKNFLVLLNPEHYKTRELYIKALSETNYDLLIVDLYYGDRPLSKEETMRLKRKANGGQRLLLSYMSVGEAADYRTYWQPSWTDERPHWLAEPNPEWPGSYKARYWSQEWHDLLYGSPDAYLDKIMAAGFDGAFLDVMDAWQYFRENE
ncbi:putative cysteine--tRNA ligase [Selenomonas sp. oral taxon 892 str. F0426]|nr:putative cysteine--tRNA ligase [Selenomonas sp. oral taxon 892 str. F0426]